MSFNGVSHTTEGHPTDAYREWREQVKKKRRRYDSPAMEEVKKKKAVKEAYKQLTQLKKETSTLVFLTLNPPSTIELYDFQNNIKKLLNKKMDQELYTNP